MKTLNFIKYHNAIYKLAEERLQHKEYLKTIIGILEGLADQSDNSNEITDLIKKMRSIGWLLDKLPDIKKDILQAKDGIHNLNYDERDELFERIGSAIGSLEDAEILLDNYWFKKNVS